MGKTKTIRTPGEAEAVTAAAEVIDLAKPVYANGGGQKTYTVPWQSRAWQMYEEIGEVANAANYMGDAFSQLRLYVGALIENEIVELDPENMDDLPPEFKAQVKPEDIVRAQDVLNALNYPHGLPELQRMFGVSLFQVGESYLLGHTNEEGEEEWDAYSTEQIFKNENSKIAVRNKPDDKIGIALNDDDFLMRVWRRDPRWSDLASSSIKSALMILEELLLLTLEVRAIITSRVPAGILVFPDSMEIVQGDQSTNGDSTSASVFLQVVQTHITTPIENPGSAAGAVPIIMKGPADDISKITTVNFGRDLSQITAEMRQELIQRFAAAINLPGEILTGKGGLNHWSAWLVDTEALNNHIQPMAKVMTNALTTQYLLPRLALDEDGMAIEGEPAPFVIGFEMSERLDDPEQTKVLFDAWDRTLISNSAMAKRIGIKDEEIPTPEEYTQRVSAKAASSAQNPGKAPPDPSQIASGHIHKKGSLKLSARERELRVRLQVAADVVMNRALEKAGARLRSLAERDKVIKERIAASNVPNELLISTFPDLLLSLNHTPNALMEGSFEQYADYWDSTVEDAQDQFVEMLAPGLSIAQQQQLKQRYDSSRSLAKPLLIGAMTALAAELAFNPSPDAPAKGEFEPNMRISAGFVRNSLILAGGGQTTMDAPSASFSANSVLESGLFSAPISSDALNESTAINVEPGYTWIYGDPGSRNGHAFEPHEALDGQEFLAWDDESVLSVGDDDWVDDFSGCFHPDDHDGCQCDYESNTTWAEGF